MLPSYMVRCSYSTELNKTIKTLAMATTEILSNI